VFTAYGWTTICRVLLRKIPVTRLTLGFSSLKACFHYSCAALRVVSDSSAISLAQRYVARHIATYRTLSLATRSAAVAETGLNGWRIDRGMVKERVSVFSESVSDDERHQELW